jgi:hypothetical protein
MRIPPDRPTTLAPELSTVERRVAASIVRVASRVSRTLALAIALGWLAYTLVSWTLVWDPADAGAYYDSALRLVSGEELYPAVDPEAHEVYRYAPWFAAAWIPMTALPRDLAIHLWSLAMVACSLAAVWPLLRKPSWASVTLAALMGQPLLETAIYGNAHPAVVALLVWTAHLRSFPAWVGVAASIKLVPLAFVLVWFGRREWRSGATALAVAAVLFAPMLLMDLSNYVTDPGTGLASLYAVSPVLWLAASTAGAVICVWLAVRRSPYAWLAVALLMFLGPPRVTTSYLAFILVAVELEERDRASGRRLKTPPPGASPA